MELANTVVTLSEITNSNGTLCSEILPTFVAYDDLDVRIYVATYVFVLLYIRTYYVYIHATYGRS